MQSLVPDADSVKRSVTDVWAVLHALGMADGAKRQTRGAMVRCLRHEERSPSCSITIGPDSTLRVFCFGCNWGGDVFSLIAAVRGFDERKDFPTIVQTAASMLGLDVTAPLPPRRAPPQPRRPPPLVEVGTLWDRCLPVGDNPVLSRALLEIRGLEPAIIADRDLARTLPPDGPLPSWARHDGQNWRDSGHVLIVPLLDAMGELQSVHARSLRLDANPKGLSPAGHSSAGLILACPFARLLLGQGIPPWWHRSELPVFIVAEGVPDFLTVACHYPEWEYAPATIGVISGAWSKEVAARIPGGCRVVIRTHGDAPGMKYRREVAESLCSRCHVEVPRHE